MVDDGHVLVGVDAVACFSGDAETTLERCDEGIALAIAGGYGLGVPYMGVNRGWALAALGDVDDGAAQILERAALADAFGAVYMRHFFLGMHAEACLMGKQFDAALASLEQAFLSVAATGEHWYEAELHRLKGEVLLALGRDPRTRPPSSTVRSRSRPAQGSAMLVRRAEASVAAAI